MAKSNADFRKLVTSGNYILTPSESSNNNSNQNKQSNDSDATDLKRQEKKRKRAERKKKYFDRKKAAKEKERAQKEEEEFTKKLKAKLSKTEKNKNIKLEELPEEYRKLIGGDLKHLHRFKGLDYNLLRQTKDKITKQQIEDIELAYNDTIINTNNNEKDIDGDIISMSVDIQSRWAQNIHKSIIKYYKNDKNDKQINRNSIKVNPKFCNGMIYKFDIESNTSIPTEIMRSQIGYGLVLDDFNEFENDNISKQLCIGFTPMNTINKIKNALNNNSDKKKRHKKNKIETQLEKPCKQSQKRTFSEMNEDNKKEIIIEDDFDIFEDVGSDYVCDIDQKPKRRRVTFMTPKMEEINKLREKSKGNQTHNSYFDNSNTNFIKNSNVKYEAASILKSSLNKAKIENAKIKRQMNEMPSLEKEKKRKGNDNSNNSLRGKLLSSGFESYDDDEYDDEDMMNTYNSDDDDQCKKTITSASADVEWKRMQDKFGKSGEKTSKSVKEKLNNVTNTPSVKQFFG